MLKEMMDYLSDYDPELAAAVKAEYGRQQRSVYRRAGQPNHPRPLCPLSHFGGLCRSRRA